MGNIIEPIILDRTAQEIKISILENASMIADKITASSKKSTIIYGFHVNSEESDPNSAVTYLKDAVGMTPARMNFANNTFNYGSWRDAFFMPRPCMVKYDGTVDYYLDENDYEKKEDGTMSALGDSTLNYGVKYPGNAMMEWGRDYQKIWTKVVPDAGNPKSGSVYIANIQIDADYTAYPFINNQGYLVNHFYTAIYNGSITAYTNSDDENVYYRLRSLPRRIPLNSTDTGNSRSQYSIPWEDGSTGEAFGFSYLTQVKHEYRLALNNNGYIHDSGYEALYIHPTSPNDSINDCPDLEINQPFVGWFTEVFCDIQLINNLLVLIGKSLNTQDIFGNGNIYGETVYIDINNGILYTGSSEYVNGEPNYDTLNKSGLFWGTSGNANAVKVFGMENWWGNQYRRYAGHIIKSNGVTQNHFIKQTFGTEDGTTAIGYNTDGTSYIDTGVEVPSTVSNIYIKAMYFLNSISNETKSYKISTFLPTELSASTYPSTIFWCDTFYRSNYSNEKYSHRGGCPVSKYKAGAFEVSFDKGIYYSFLYNTALSFKPFIEPINVVE